MMLILQTAEEFLLPSGVLHTKAQGRPITPLFVIIIGVRMWPKTRCALAGSEITQTRAAAEIRIENFDLMPPPHYTGFLKLLYDWQPIIAGVLALLVGLFAAALVVWQVRLIKRQVAFSTYLDLDKEWNSKEMIEARQQVHPHNGKELWNGRV